MTPVPRRRTPTLGVEGTVVMLVCALTGCTGAGARASSPAPLAPRAPGALLEASGIALSGTEVLIVVDENPRGFFRLPAPGWNVGLERSLRPDPTRVRFEPWGSGRQVPDPESIAVLTDGRIVALSEKFYSLAGGDGVVVSYDDPFSPLGKRGLEGLAVRELPNGASRLAVLWEGGYASSKNLLPEIDAILDGRALKPVILVHDLAAGETGIRVKIAEADAPAPLSSGFGRLIQLQVPDPDPDPDREATQPSAHRYRAPDLVWDESEEGAWSFIVLLSSHHFPDDPLQQDKFRYQELRRFSLEGKDLGRVVDLKRVLPADLQRANWEGLAWLERGKRLVLVHDTPPEGVGTTIFIVDVAEDEGAE